MVENTEGYDPNIIIDKFKNYVPSGSKVLELGMGPGTDFQILKQSYKMTGSDSSDAFLDLYREKDNGAHLINLDAITLKTSDNYDAIYSNKVLVHLSKDELKQSLLRQSKILNTNGIAFHTFWHGDKEEEMDGLRFVYYTVDQIINIVPKKFEILESSLYEEMEKEDSICLVLKKED